MPNFMTYPQALQLYEKIDQNKQDTLVEGKGISIDGNVISATGGITVSVDDETIVFSQAEEEGS